MKNTLKELIEQNKTEELKIIKKQKVKEQKNDEINWDEIDPYHNFRML